MHDDILSWQKEDKSRLETGEFFALFYISNYISNSINISLQTVYIFWMQQKTTDRTNEILLDAVNKEIRKTSWVVPLRVEIASRKS